MRWNDRTAKIALGVVIGLGLVLRLAWALGQGSQITRREILPDQAEYLQIGSNLLHGDGLSYFDPRFDDVVYAYRTPGYPLFIAACDASPRIVRLAQAFVDSATILAVYLLARRWASARAGVVAAAIMAVNPFLIYFTGLILSETLFTALLIWGFVLIVRAKEPWRLSWIAGGLVMGLAALVRPSAIGLPVLIAIAAAIANYTPQKPSASRWPLPVGAGMLAIILLVLFPWALRNRLKVSQWVWTSTNEGITQYDGFNPDADGSSNQAFVKQMPWLKDMNETSRSHYLSGLADEYIRENPWHCLRLAIAKIGRTWSPMPLSEAFGGRGIYVLAALAYALPLDGLVLAGLLLSGLPKRAKFLLLCPAIYFTVVHAASVGSLRYRIPAEPPLAVLAAVLFEKRLSRQTPQPVGAETV